MRLDCAEHKATYREGFYQMMIHFLHKKYKEKYVDVQKYKPH